VVERRERHHNNQPEAPADKRRWQLESWQPLETMRDGGCTARIGEKEMARCEDERHMQRQMRCNNRQRETSFHCVWDSIVWYMPKKLFLVVHTNILP